MRIIRYVVLAVLYNQSIYAQWDITTVSNEVSTTDEIVGPVLRLSNEIRVPNTFIATDPSIGTLDNSGYGINIHKTHGIGFAFNGVHRTYFGTNGNITTTASNPKISIKGTGTGNYQGANLVLTAEGVTLGKKHVSTWFMTHRGTDGTATIEMQRRGAGDEYNGTPLLYKDGYGWRFNIAGSTSTSSISNGLMIKEIGVGIGTTSPLAKLHVTSGTSGDAVLRLEADTDNSNESDNAEINFVQDGGLVEAFIGLEGNINTKSTYTLANALILGSEQDRPVQIITNDEVKMTLNSTGVGIGTTTPDAKLAVKGNIHAEEVKVDLSVPGPDYVFNKDYDLKSLEEVQNHIKAHGHLPNIPSAKEMETNGIQLSEMNMKLLEKIEELTLYVLQQQNRIKNLEETIINLKK